MNKFLLPKQLTSKWFFLALVLASLPFMISRQVAAGSSNTLPQYGFLGSVTAYANVQSFRSPESSNGFCYIKSYTSPSTTINVIGWTWRQCDILNDGNVIDSRNWGGSAITGSFNDAPYTWWYAFESGNGLKSHGVHDFNHDGSNPSPWRPYIVNVYP